MRPSKLYFNITTQPIHKIVRATIFSLTLPVVDCLRWPAPTPTAAGCCARQVVITTK